MRLDREKNMELGINVRNWGPTATPEFIRDSVLAADESNLDALWFNDHLCFPPVIANNFYNVPQAMGSIIDPLSLASFIAGITKRIKFGTAILVLPYREKIVTTKMIASIQQLSNNRFLLGVGSGYLEEEFNALGINLKDRGKITNEVLDFLLKASKNSKVISNEQEILLEPKLTLPPIYIGQMAKVAFDRTIRFGRGWMPVSISPEELGPKVIELKKRAKAAGRDKIEIIAMKTLPLDDLESAKKMAVAYKDAGATQLVHTQGYETVEHYCQIIEKLENSIKPLI